MKLIVERFKKNHPSYTDKVILKDGKKYQSSFGRMILEDGTFLCYTLERRDTLISLGVRKFKFYNSPKNKAVVLLFEDEPGSGTYARKFEFHIANYAYELEGCTAGGVSINMEVPALSQSKAAFQKVMKLVNNIEGTIEHKYL